MKQAKRKLIDKIAEKILESFHETVPILDMNAFVRKLGGELVTDYSVMDNRIKKDNKGFKILVASNNFNDKRIHFTIAHEIGHLFLHMGFLSESEQWHQKNTGTYNCLETPEKESEANEFAAALLMPEEEYRRQIEKHILLKKSSEKVLRTDLSKTADFFHVSVLAAHNRGLCLGILK